ncbi:hypothetical protein FA95DRAFT_1641761, partial [Auriscalpium vulgare]
MPLEIYLEFPYAGPEWRHRFIARNISRTTSLYAGVNFDFSSRATILNAFSAGAPLLHTLKLEVKGFSLPPDNFLGRHAPALRDLHLLTTWIMTRPLRPLSFSIFARLTSLRIDNIYGSNDYPFHELLNGLLDGLEVMHDLERLKINLFPFNEDMSTIAAQEPFQQHRGVTLAKLKYLGLSASLREATMLLFHLSLPAYVVTCYTLTVSTEDSPDRFLPLILEPVQCRTDSVIQSSNAITTLYVGTSEKEKTASRRCETVIFARTDAHCEDSSGWHPHEPSLTIRFSDHARTALNVLAYAHLRDLIVDCDVLENSPWPALPTLRRLLVRGAAVVSLCASLRSVPPVLPALVLLKFVDMLISMTAGKGGAQGEAMRKLPRILAARAEAGCRLEELNVRRCIVDEEWVVRAKKELYGTRVEWEKDALESEEDSDEERADCE